jgi:hypothetical protein
MVFDASRSMTMIWNLPGFPSFAKNLSMEIGGWRLEEVAAFEGRRSRGSEVKALSLELGECFILS